MFSSGPEELNARYLLNVRIYIFRTSLFDLIIHRTLMTSCDLYREDVNDAAHENVDNEQRRCVMVATRIQCTSFLSRFFKSPETSILEVSLV